MNYPGRQHPALEEFAQACKAKGWQGPITWQISRDGKWASIWNGQLLSAVLGDMTQETVGIYQVMEPGTDPEKVQVADAASVLIDNRVNWQSVIKADGTIVKARRPWQDEFAEMRERDPEQWGRKMYGGPPGYVGQELKRWHQMSAEEKQALIEKDRAR